MSLLQHLTPEQRAALRDDVQGASVEAYCGGSVLRARAQLKARGLVMHVRHGGVRAHRAGAPPGERPLQMLPDADAVLAWLASEPPP